MIRIPERDDLTQARWPGEVKLMARSYIAVSTGQPVKNVVIRIVRSRWWKQARKQSSPKIRVLIPSRADHKRSLKRYDQLVAECGLAWASGGFVAEDEPNCPTPTVRDARFPTTRKR
jgi:hypothetical protein